MECLELELAEENRKTTERVMQASGTFCIFTNPSPQGWNYYGTTGAMLWGPWQGTKKSVLIAYSTRNRGEKFIELKIISVHIIN